MERMSNASADGGKGILDSLNELEDRIKGYCKENFALQADLKGLENTCQKKWDT